MFSLSKKELEAGRDAIFFHGVGSFFPPQPELRVLHEDWEKVVNHLEKLDLDTYKPSTVLKSYVAKDSKVVRPIELLHIQDTLILVSLCRLLRDAIEAARLPVGSRKSFSYRSGSRKEALYETSGAYEKYREQTAKRLGLLKTKYVATVDIADFFSNVYQHRLENSLQAAAQSTREEDAVRVLAKLLSNFSGNNSYGIPTGPYACRILAEALLIDVDGALEQKGVDFVRWMDDFTVFTKSHGEAVEVIQYLSKWLREHHGLNLNLKKTDIYEKEKFVSDVWKTYDEEHKHFRDLVKRMQAEDLYDIEDEDELDEGDEEDDLSAEDVASVFDLALRIEDEPKFGLVRHVLERVIFRDDFDTAIRRQIIDTAIENVDSLSPVLDAVCKAMARSNEFTKTETKKFCNSILGHLSKKSIFVPGHSLFWIVWLIGEAELTQLSAKLLNIFQNTDDLVVRRECLVAMSKVSSRADVLHVKETYDSLPPSVRIALVMATSRMAKDERSHWKKSKLITDVYEKAVFSFDS